jgi:Domain of unknown function (DUF4159)
MSFLAATAPRFVAVVGVALPFLLVGPAGGPSASSASEAAVHPAEVSAGPRQQALYQVPYNGSFTFTRIRYGARGGQGLGGWGRSSAWNHDYPGADRNIQQILDEFTYLRSNTSGSNVVDLDDPRIFQHPILYMSEPGYWTATEEDIANLRAFLLKGGFLIFDDFEMEQWNNMAYQVRRALPEHEWIEIDGSHPIFRSFYQFADIYVPHPLVAVKPNYQAIFEGNDPTKDIMVLANHNSDLGEYWEWSTRGAFGIAPTNDAYRLGVNYMIYAMVH